MYTYAVNNHGHPFDSCVGFMDCTKIQMSRPGVIAAKHRTCYTGHKLLHFLINQTGTTADGQILHMYGTELGHRHDIAL